MSVVSCLAALAVAASPNYQQILDQLRMEQAVPGASAVVTYGDEVLFAGGSGLADLRSGREMTADTLVYAGSLTKILTAIMTLRLVEAGKLTLDDRVSEIAADSSPGSGDITVYHLLTHTSGLEREGDFGYWFNGLFPGRGELARYLASAALRAAPGESSHYSNIGYAALGVVLERASGRSYSETLQTLVFEPLGMRLSGAPGPKSGVARGYTPVGRLLPNEQRPFAGVGRQEGQRHLREYHNARAMTPAFGAYTTANDMGALVRFLLGFTASELLPEELRLRLLTSQESGRGLGLRVGRLNDRALARHDGWFAAHRSHVLLDLEAGIGVAVLANSDSASPGLIAEALAAAALEFGPASP